MFGQGCGQTEGVWVGILVCWCKLEMGFAKVEDKLGGVISMGVVDEVAGWLGPIGGG